MCFALRMKTNASRTTHPMLWLSSDRDKQEAPAVLLLSWKSCKCWKACKRIESNHESGSVGGRGFDSYDRNFRGLFWEVGAFRFVICWRQKAEKMWVGQASIRCGRSASVWVAPNDPIWSQVVKMSLILARAKRGLVLSRSRSYISEDCGWTTRNGERSQDVIVTNRVRVATVPSPISSLFIDTTHMMKLVMSDAEVSSADYPPSIRRVWQLVPASQVEMQSVYKVRITTFDHCSLNPLHTSLIAAFSSSCIHSSINNSYNHTITNQSLYSKIN